MLVEALDKLSPGDVLLLDRGYPAAWLVALLCERGVRFVMRCDKLTGWSAVRQFLRSGADQAQVTLNAPSAQDVADWGCPATAPNVRVVRNLSSTGRVRVLATNLDAADVPVECFGDLYHVRRKIDEAFKRLKHRCASAGRRRRVITGCDSSRVRSADVCRRKGVRHVITGCDSSRVRSKLVLAALLATAS